MSTATLPAPAGHRAASAYRLTFGHVLRSEWIKFRTLRSTIWTLGITVVIMVGFALMFAATVSSIPDDATQGGVSIEGMLSGTMIVTIGYTFAQLVIAVLGALVITGEYSTGMIRSTFSAVPARLPALWAKLVVLVVTTFLLTTVGLALSYLVTYPILDSHGITVDLGDSAQLQSLLGTAVYMATVAAFALGVGTLLRASAGSIFTVVAVFFVLPLVFQIVVGATGAEWAQEVYKFLPSVLGDRLIAGGPTADGELAPWAAYGVLAGYTAIVLGAAAVSLKKRDA